MADESPMPNDKNLRSLGEQRQKSKHKIKQSSVDTKEKTNVMGSPERRASGAGVLKSDKKELPKKIPWGIKKKSKIKNKNAFSLEKLF